MRRYDIVSGILLILFIIDFALAAPVLVQEKRQACVYGVHIPRDVITVLGKRAGEELEKLAEQYLEKGPPAPESLDVHESPSTAPSAPPTLDHVSTNVEQAPTLNSPVSSTANPSPLMEPSNPSSSSSASSTSSSDSEDYGWLFETEGDDASHKPLYPFTLSGYNPGLDHGLTWADAPQPNPNPFTLSGYNPGLDHGFTGADAPQPNLNPNPKKRPLAEPDGRDPDFPWDTWMAVVNESPPRPAKWPKLSDQANEYQVKRPLTEPDGPDPDFPWDVWMAVVNKSPPRPVSLPKLSDQANAYQTEHVQYPGPPKLGRPLTDPYFDMNQPPSSVPISEVPVHLLPSTSARLLTEPKHEVESPSSPNLEPSIYPEHEVLHGPPPSPATPELGRLTDPELHLNPQSSSTESQPVDLLSAINALRGKGKETRRTFGLTRDVGNGESGE